MARIFVVDDDEQLLRMVGMILERGNHTPVLESRPENVLARLVTEKPDLLILDVMMPGVTGHDLCLQIRKNEQTAELPILILTARAQPIDRAAALESGANDYMSKPISPQDLLARVDDLLQRFGTGHNEQPAFTIGVIAMRGGTGCTTLATNLATALRRVSQKSVALVDLSPSVGQVVMHLRLQARTSWADLPDNGHDLAWPAIQNSLLHHQSGLMVLASPDLPQPVTAPAGAKTDRILQLLSSHMDFVVLDLPPLLSPAVEAALAQCDMILYIVAPEVIAVKSAIQSHWALNKLATRQETSIFILNQHMSQAQLSPETVEKGLKTRLALKIPFDPQQQRALAQGEPLALTESASPIGTSMTRFAEAIYQRVAAKT